MRKILIVIAVAAFVVACSDEQHTYVPNVAGNPNVPTMSTVNVTTLISDSGYTRYNIETPLWNIYDNTDQPQWKFPQGLNLLQYDLNMRPQASMRCDSATYWSQKRLWRLDGHVVMVNVLRDTMMSAQVYWDQMQQRVYSDSFVHIVRREHIIEGYGFESNQNMTAYNVNRPTAIIPLSDDNRPGGNKPALEADTAPGQDVAGRRYAPPPASQRHMVNTLTVSEE